VVAEQLLSRAKHVRRLALLLMLGTAFLGMWMSNVAAAALVLAAAQPVLSALKEIPRRRVLVALAMGANLGGVATPIGTGPNGIAIAALADRTTITFTTWMGFGVPLAACLLGGTYLILRPGLGEEKVPASARPPPPLSGRGRAVVALAVIAIIAWLTEPIHGVPSAIVALALAASLFASGLLATTDLREIDWSTLLLIAGGVTLGKVLEETHLLEPAIAAVASSGLPLVVLQLALCAVAAVLAALMSNTGTAALLIPVALRLDSSPTTALLVALATSLGVPFVISTPPNAMVAAEGVPAGDLLRPGLVILIGGVVALAVTGPAVLSVFGLR
jgi:sodium-dependent dicarboxylate transporter 2/3/5